jgi:hypothetical protein
MTALQFLTDELRLAGARVSHSFVDSRLGRLKVVEGDGKGPKEMVDVDTVTVTELLTPA